MEASVRKTKITGSMLPQTLVASLDDLRNFQILGFCLHKGKRWIVLSKEPDLRKYPFFSSAAPDSDFAKTSFWTKVVFTGFSPNTYKTESLEKSTELAQFFNDLKQQAIAAGQFFI